MATPALHDAQAQLRAMELKLKKKDNEIRRLKSALRALSEQTESEEDSFGPSEDEKESDMDTSDEDEENFPRPIQSLECKDIYLCTNAACGGEVTDGYCFRCGTRHQLLEDEHATSTESQLDHPDRHMAPRGDTPIRDIDPYPIVPKPYASREHEYMRLLKLGATQEMCELFDLEYTYEGGIYAQITEELFEEFAGPEMQDGDAWRICLGRRLTLDENDKNGYEFIESILDEISVLPSIGGWVTEDEGFGMWVTYLKHANGLENPQKDIMDLKDVPAEHIPMPTQANDYDLSDDDSEQADIEMDDPAFFTTCGISYLHVDRWYDGSDANMNISASASDGEEEFDELEGGDNQSETSTISDSDEAGSDFDSDEVLSGDEATILPSKPQPVAIEIPAPNLNVNALS